MFCTPTRIAAMLVIACIATSPALGDMIEHFQTPGSAGVFSQLTNVLDQVGIGGTNDSSETTGTHFTVPGTGGETELTFTLRKDTGGFKFTFGYYDISAVTADPLSDKLNYAVQALTSATQVFDDRVDAPGTTSTHAVEAGTALGFFIVPDSTIEDVLADPESFFQTQPVPLFSVSDANPGDFDQMLSFIGDDLTLFAFEDETRTGDSGQDFSDLAFSINAPLQPPLDPPTITLLGDNPFTYSGDFDRSFVDPGASAVDARGNDLAGNTVISGTIDDRVLGTYELTYTVTDEYGKSSSAVRSVIIVDTSPPRIPEEIDHSAAIVRIDREYHEEGAGCFDYVERNLDSQVIIGGDIVDSNVSGIYRVTYNCADSSGNQATERTFIVAVESRPGDPVSVALFKITFGDGDFLAAVWPTATPANFTANSFTTFNAIASSSQPFAPRFFFFEPISEGEFTIRVDAGVFTDRDGNPNLASNTLTWFADFGSPGITLSTDASDTVGAPITVVATLSEASTDFTSNDVTTTNATVDGFTGSGVSYSFTLSPIESGPFSASVPAGVFTDDGGNSNLASNTVMRTADLSAECLYKTVFRSEWPFMAEDLDMSENVCKTWWFRHIPERWAIAMVRHVLCRPDHPWHDRTLEVFNFNLDALQNEPEPVFSRVEPYQHTLAALLLVSQGRQNYFKELLGLTGDYQTVRGHRRNVEEEPFSEEGDLDGDGFPNLEEYENIIASGGTMDEFTEATDDPDSRGMPGMSSVSTLGLALLVSTIASLFALTRSSARGKPVAVSLKRGKK